MKIQSAKTLSQGPVKMLVYGGSGIGKTSLVKTLDVPVFVISAEKGLLSIAGSDIDYVDLSVDDEGRAVPQHIRGQKLRDAYAYLQTPEARAKYKAVMLDSITEIAENVLELYKTTAKGWDIWNGYTAEIVNLIKAFRDMDHYHVVFTALEDVEKDEAARRFFAPSIDGKAAKQFIQPAFDQLFRYTFVEVDGKMQRRLITTESPQSKAKDRSGKLLALEEPNLANIIKKIRGEI